MKELENKMLHGLENDFPFVIYRKSNSNDGIGLFQNSTNAIVLDDVESDSFVFAPFDNRNEKLLIRYSGSEKIRFEINNSFKMNSSIIHSSEINLARSKHVDLVQDGIDCIHNSSIEKVVLSRKESIKVEQFHLLETFEKLCANYPNAFVYAWFHPVSGIWMGATPERLLTVQNTEFKVMALASTQKFNGALDVNWGKKEKEEHQIVVDYIVSKLNNEDIEISKTYTVRAGNLLHLRADITGKITDSYQEVIDLLHPTPATCGLPKKESKEFILENEGYNREYYTGYLGEIEKNKTDLYVNLRCMKVDLEKNMANIFIGGGITKDSIPENEWDETVAKSTVMKKVL